MTNEQIEEALKLDAERTEGPWSLDPCIHGDCICDATRLRMFDCIGATNMDARYLTASTHPDTGWAATLREVQRLRAEQNVASSLVGCTKCRRGQRYREMVELSSLELLCRRCAADIIRGLRAAP